MVVNESFLDSATVRENVVSLARNIGYVPRSRTAAKAQVSFNIPTTATPTLTLQRGLVCIGSVDNTSYTFSIPGNISSNVVDGFAYFNDIEIYQYINGSINNEYNVKVSAYDNSNIANLRYVLTITFSN
jgi:hypothetical protein